MITALLVSVLLLVLNAFFVAAEFALVASKRHRLEEAAEQGSRAAEAAVKGSRELSLMLAGAQLGITLCTLGLGSLAKPAVAELLSPVLTFLRLPEEVAYVVAVILAVGIVVFLHMVVGEMAPKSWAISHPERSALMLALPFRAFAWVARPVLSALNALANATLRLVRVEPQDELAQVHGPDELLLLLGAAREHGMLAEPEHRVLAGAIDLDTTALTSAMVPLHDVVSVDRQATCDTAEDLSRASGRSRLVVTDRGEPIGLAHVRDIVRAPAETPVAAVATEPLRLSSELSLLDAVSAMRAERAQLVLVTDGTGPVGLVSMEDLLERVLGHFEDETDPHR
jgi:CBS domain containing-hemolysin-like protein